ncbi:hypothetical protein BJ912DRAFT_987756 [Pholiota molesta]|nr:hypothetical protein BJ912DRAFT_987756 [Pholiota molesta]
MPSGAAERRLRGASCGRGANLTLGPGMGGGGSEEAEEEREGDAEREVCGLAEEAAVSVVVEPEPASGARGTGEGGSEGTTAGEEGCAALGAALASSLSGAMCGSVGGESTVGAAVEAGVGVVVWVSMAIGTVKLDECINTSRGSAGYGFYSLRGGLVCVVGSPAGGSLVSRKSGSNWLSLGPVSSTRAQKFQAVYPSGDIFRPL